MFQTIRGRDTVRLFDSLISPSGLITGVRISVLGPRATLIALFNIIFLGQLLSIHYGPVMKNNNNNNPPCGKRRPAYKGNGGIAITIDAIDATFNLLLSAGKASQSDYDTKVATNHALLAGMISTGEGAFFSYSPRRTLHHASSNAAYSEGRRRLLRRTGTTIRRRVPGG